MKPGERYMDKAPYGFRCRAIVAGSRQCGRAAKVAVGGVAMCTMHSKGLKNGKPCSYVFVP
jgi:hypothetical protein